MKEYIERSVLIEHIKEELSFCEGQDPEKRPVLYGCEFGLRGAMLYATIIPTADVVECKRGEWETSREIDWDGNLVYDHFHRGCGHTYTNHIESGANFCPNCGADMRRTEGEDV